jgi:aspartate carbamoyltransferase catalytic subunit
MYKNNALKDIDWQEFQQLSLKEKAPYFLQSGHPYHALVSQQFDRVMLDKLCGLATKIRMIGKTRGGLHFLKDLLSDKRGMLYFSQPSSRTFLSFYAACQILGIQPAEVRDASTSSEIKGESKEDSVRTFSSYFDLIIMRHPVGGFAERIAWLLSNTDRSVPVINAGSGKDQHPTQALLDIYTLERSFEHQGGIEGKKIAFVGDLARGRTVRSLSNLLTLYPGVKQYFIAPESLQIGEDILSSLTRAGIEYEVSVDFEKLIPEVDAIYMTRIQDEWDLAKESSLIDTRKYHFTAAHLDLLKSTAVILHPLPRRKEIDVAVDSDPRAVYWRQVRNGMWIRAALILSIFDRTLEVDRYYEDLTS